MFRGILVICFLFFSVNIFALDYSKLVPDNKSVQQVAEKYKRLLPDERAEKNGCNRCKRTPRDGLGKIKNDNKKGNGDKLAELRKRLEQKFGRRYGWIRNWQDIYKIPVGEIQQLIYSGQFNDFITYLQLRNYKLYIFYLFSASMPYQSVENVFEQFKALIPVFKDYAELQGLSGVEFRGVVRGISKERRVYKLISKFTKGKDFQGVHILINPLIFKAVGAKKVPAFVIGACPAGEHFRTKLCEFKYVLYGDMTLLHALEVISDKTGDIDIRRLYQRARVYLLTK